jgi:hypothetical protein
MSDTTETRWFKIIVFIFSAIIVGLFIANVVYYNRIRTGGTVTTGEATSMLWLSVIFLIVGIIVFLWSIWSLVFSKTAKESVKHYMLSPTSGYDLPTPGIATSPRVVPSVVTTSNVESGIVTAPGTESILAQEENYF